MKPEVVFGLEGAAWPALLVNASGSILRANSAAMTVFGPVLSGEAPPLSAIWSLDNGGTDGQFLMLWEQAPTATADLNFRVAGKAVVKFTVAICTFNKDGSKWFVLQLLPFVEPVAPPVPVPAAPAPAAPAPAEIPKPAAPAAPADAGGLALKQKLDCALQLARTVSIDFNNALTSVLGHVSLLLGKTEAGHPWRHSLLEVEKSAERAAEIANELQTFSRQEKEARRQPPGNLNAVTDRCVEFFRNAHGAKITWKELPERNLFGARFDEAKVQQVFTKILENAVEAVGLEGQGQITVSTRNVDLTETTQDRNVKLAAGTYVCVEVADNGRGIDAETLPRIFEPFFTTKGKTHRGLGLALAYGIVTNHGGGVAVSSQQGAGAAVRIYLPAEKGLLREMTASNENLHGTETILVVDDEPLMLTMAETILTEFGYRVLTAGSGQKAMAILSREDTKVDLLITDLVMPVMSGRELVERVRQLRPETKILCMSGYLMPADRQSGTAYLQKPFTSREMLAKVKLVVASHQVVD
jgi:two-component system, cell cycle sensor histidine kinase and response regulator CckA